LYNYYKDDKDEKDEKEASKWVQMAAENGYAAAQYAVGRQFYAKGEPQEAIKYLTQAANQEHGQAQHILGLLLYQKSSYQNLDSAETWLQKATRNGRTEAQALLQKVQEEKRLRYLAAFRDLNLKTTNSSSSSSTGSTEETKQTQEKEKEKDDDDENEDSEDEKKEKKGDGKTETTTSTTISTTSEEKDKKKKPVAEGRECSMCGNILPKSAYVARQWKAKRSTRRCKQCSIDMIE